MWCSGRWVANTSPQLGPGATVEALAPLPSPPAKPDPLYAHPAPTYERLDHPRYGGQREKIGNLGEALEGLSRHDTRHELCVLSTSSQRAPQHLRGKVVSAVPSCALVTLAATFRPPGTTGGYALPAATAVRRPVPPPAARRCAGRQGGRATDACGARDGARTPKCMAVAVRLSA